MGLRRSVRLADRQPVSAEDAAEALLALRGVGATPDRPGLGCSGSAEAMSGRPGSHVDATPPRGPLPISDEEAEEEAGPSGLQAAGESDAEDDDRLSDADQGRDDYQHSTHEAEPWWRPGEC